MDVGASQNPRLPRYLSRCESDVDRTPFSRRKCPHLERPGCRKTEDRAGRDLHALDMVALTGCCGSVQGAVTSSGHTGASRLEDNRGCLCPEFEGASVDDGPENIAGRQNADRVTGAVEDRNLVNVFIEHDVGDLADLCRR